MAEKKKDAAEDFENATRRAARYRVLTRKHFDELGALANELFKDDAESVLAGLEEFYNVKHISDVPDMLFKTVREQLLRLQARRSVCESASLSSSSLRLRPADCSEKPKRKS